MLRIRIAQNPACSKAQRLLKTMSLDTQQPRADDQLQTRCTGTCTACRARRRGVAEAEGVAFWVHLRRNISETYLGNMNRYPPERWVVLVPGYLGRVLRRGIHTQGSIARVTTLIKRMLATFACWDDRAAWTTTGTDRTVEPWGTERPSAQRT